MFDAMSMKRQVVVIHGGTSFDSYEDYIAFIKTRELTLEKLRESYDWKASLQRELGDDFDVLQPRMPNGTNARFEEWKLWFERCAKLLDDGVILVGHSLGGIFLAKYLSENSFPKKIKATVLVAAPFDDVSTDEKLTEFALPASLEKFAEQGGSIHIVHSKDDPVVPFHDVAKYLNQLTEARDFVFDDRGHFNQEEFPELIRLIREL
jgi:uncharacterized protein